MDSKDHSYFTLDTNVIRGLSFNFDNVLLKNLYQLKKIGVKVIFSDVVYSEMIEHYSKILDESRVNCLKNLDLANKLILKDDSKVVSILNELRNLKDMKALAKSKIDDYFREIGAETISAQDYASFDEVLKRYFEQLSPFESKKQCEFKDAIALNTLETYGVLLQKKIYTISDDKGWHNFCSESDWLCCMGFEDALNEIQSVSGKYELFIKEFAGCIFDKKSSLHIDVLNKLKSVIYDDSPKLIDSGKAYCEIRKSNIEIKDFLVPDKKVNILFIDDTECTFSIPCKLNLRVDLIVDVFSDNPYHSGDWDSEPEKVLVENIENVFDFEVLITFEGLWGAGLENMSLEDVSYTYNDFSVLINSLK